MSLFYLLLFSKARSKPMKDNKCASIKHLAQFALFTPTYNPVRYNRPRGRGYKRRRGSKERKKKKRRDKKRRLLGEVLGSEINEPIFGV